MKKSQMLKRVLAVLLAMALLVLSVPAAFAETVDEQPQDVVDTEQTADEDTEEGAEEGETEAESTVSVDTYMQYYDTHSGEERPADSVVLSQEQLTGVAVEENSIATHGDKTGMIISKDNAYCEWTVDVPTSGIYNMYFDYYPLAESGRDITLKVLIDGKVPFVEAATLSLSRLWKDATEIKTDDLGNDLRPSQVERSEWMNAALIDVLGMYQDPYFFYLEAGTHTIRVERVREAMAIERIVLKNKEALQSYEDYVAQFDADKKPQGPIHKLEAETPYSKSSSTLYASTDHQDPGTTPNHPTDMKLNYIGGGNWSANGQTITWEVPADVEEGWYQLAFRARQNANQGMVSYRALSINGEIPFAEAQELGFYYDADWKVYAVGGEEVKPLYLKAGDKISLSCVAGVLADALRKIQESVLNLNQLYRDIIVVTGTAPDIYQDYYLEDEIPGLQQKLLDEKQQFIDIVDTIISVTGKTGSQTSVILEAAEKLGIYASKSYEITANLGEFKGNIESLSSLLLTFGGQPLDVDCLYFVPVGEELPSPNVSFWESLKYSVAKFFGSFFNDYQIENTAKNKVTAWVTTGRDQMQVLSSMITEFTNDTKIPIQLNLVDTHDTLIQATMAGKGPDVALMIDSTFVINLSMRGALVNLNGGKFNIEKEREGVYNEAAWRRFRYNGGVYAIPETQAFPIMFYRTDIFEEMDLTPPDTWDEFYEVLRTLQGRNMNVGMTETATATPGVSGSIEVFQSLLFQRGGDYYNESLTKTLFDQPEAYEAFEQWAELYSKFGVARSVDFYNRFRTGDVPIGFITFGTYNQLAAAAPELRGLWKMALIPGIPQTNEDGTPKLNEDGTQVIDRSTPAGGFGAMMLTTAQKHGVEDEAYEFLKWWTSTESQIRYGSELEATMGVAARYTPASIEAFAEMGWTDEELAVLEEQRSWAKNVYPVPGDYMLARSLTNAVRASLDRSAEPRRMLARYNRDINAEIERKRKEFGLD